MIAPTAKIIMLGLTLAALTSCTRSIQPVGMLGPNQLRVFVVKDNDFLSASRMLVILDKKGNVSAYSGGTVAGTGSVALQTMDTAVNAGAVVAGAKAIEHGLENIKVKGIPKSVSIKSSNTLDVTGQISKIN